MPKPSPPTANPFIVSTGPAKPQSDARKLIRSHVMLGKNKGKTLPARRVKRPAQSPLDIVTQDSSNQSSPQSDGTDASSSASELELIRSAARRSIPQRVGSELSLISFADDIDPYHVSSILKFSTIAKRAKYPLAVIMAFDPRERQSWLGPLFSDAAYLHALTYSTRAYFDSMVGLPGRAAADPEWSIHLSKALLLLRERLGAGESVLRRYRTTAYSVSSLIVCAHLVGDLATASRHMQGLRTIVSLAGGVNAYRRHCKLMLEMSKCDLALALQSGGAPCFFSESVLEPLLPFPVFPATSSAAESWTGSDMAGKTTADARQIALHPRLLESYHTLRAFARHVNETVAAGSLIQQELVFETMASTMYRLLSLKLPIASRDEAVRLTLLMFCGRTFLAPDTCAVPSAAFSKTYRHGIIEAREACMEIDSWLWVWILMVGAVSPFAEAEDHFFRDWLQADLKESSITTWEELLAVLHSFMWVGMAFDEPAKRAFAALDLEAP